MDTQLLSEDTAQDGDSVKLVPVAESIRYRKRAQSAEKKIEELTEQLEQAQRKSTEMAGQLENIRTEQKLTQKLIAAGSIDVESALLVATERMKNQEQANVDEVVEQLRKDKQFLFRDSGDIVTAEKTAGAKERSGNVYTILARAAQKAATTGSRKDLQEYLKLRRNYL
jgi:uncharacterized protein YhaN